MRTGNRASASRHLDGTAAEAWEDAGPLTFEALLDGESGFEVAVDYATSDDTAVAEEDHVDSSGTVTFSPGELVKKIRVAFVDGESRRKSAKVGEVGESRIEGRVCQPDAVKQQPCLAR